MKEEVIKTGYDVERKILSEQDIVSVKFKSFGFKAFENKVAYAQGYPIYIGGYDASGKSELMMELQLQLSELYDQKHLIFTGEIGQVHEVYLELYWKYGKKPYRKYDYYGNENHSYQTEKERSESREFINNHFLVVDVLRLPEIFRFDQLTTELRDHLNTGLTVSDVDTISIDGVYEVTREEAPQTEQQLEALLNKVYRYGINNNKTIMMSTHVANKNGFLELEGGAKYPKPPSKYNWTMGMMWSRKGYQLLNAYRPSTKYDYFGNGELAEGNELWVENEKSKPKGLTKPGTSKIFFDIFANRYYEMIDNKKKFSRDWQKEESDMVYDAAKALEPNKDFTTTTEKPPF